MPPTIEGLICDKPGHLIRRLQQIAVALFMQQTKKFDITPVQYAALLAIDLNPGIDQTALVNIIAYDRSTIGDVVARLEAKKLIRRVSGNLDRRTKLLASTPRARKLIPDIEKAVMEAQEMVLAPLSPSDHFIRRDITAIGSWYYHFSEFGQMLELYRSGLRLTDLITHRYPFAQADAAYKMFTSGQSCKVLFDYRL